MSAQFEAMRWWHLDEVVAIDEAAFADTAWTPETFWSELAHPESRWYVVARAVAETRSGVVGDGSVGDGEVMGYAGLMVQGSEGDVQTIAVAERARAQGLGRRLLHELMAAARDRGATSLLLEVRADNPVAIALYASEGFERIAVRRAYYQPGGIDAHIMRRRPL